MAAAVLEERILLTVGVHIEEPAAPDPAYGPVTPQAIVTNLLPASESTQTVTLAIGPGSTDVVFVVQESSTLTDEKAWLSEAVAELNTQLVAANSTDNRFALIGYGASVISSVTGYSYGNAASNLVVSIYDDNNTLIKQAMAYSAYPTTADLSNLTLPKSGEYRVVVQSSNASLVYDYSLVIDDVTPTASVPLVMNQLTSGRIVDARTVRSYPFTLSTASTVYFEALSQSDLQWSLTGPNGVVIDHRNFSAGNLPLSLATTGSYTLSVAGTPDAVGTYAIRLIDITGTASSFATGATVNGNLPNVNKSNVHRFTATAGDRLYFESKSPTISANYRWRLLEPSGNLLFAGALKDDREVPALPTTGTYTVVIDGDPAQGQPQSYSFTVHNNGPVASPQSLTLGTAVSTSISKPGEADRFSFTLSSPTIIILDSQTNSATVAWSLTGPQGVVVSNLALNAGDQVLRLESGTYELTMDGTGKSTGNYAFNVLSLASATSLTLGTAVSGSLAAVRSAKAYTFTAAAGEKLAFDNTSWSGDAAGRWMLIDPQGQVLFDLPITQDVAGITARLAGQYAVVLKDSVAGSSGTPSFGFRVDSLGTNAANSVALVPNEVVSDEITVPGGQKSYTLTLNAGLRLSMDVLRGAGTLHWSLADGGGTIVSSRSMTASDGVALADGSAVLSLGTGTYTLTVAADSGTTGSFAFRLLDLATSARSLTFGTTTSNSAILETGTGTVVYRLPATSGDWLRMDGKSWNGASDAVWRILSPAGAVVASGLLSQDSAYLNAATTGDYLLLIEGGLSETALIREFSFTVEKDHVVSSQSIALATEVPATIASAGDVRDFTFTASAGDTMQFDWLAAPTTSFQMRLRAPDGSIVASNNYVSAQNYSAAAPTFTLPMSGSYRIQMDGGGATGDFRFRLQNAAQSPEITFGDDFEGSISQPRIDSLFHFHGEAGQSIALRPDVWQSSAQMAQSATRLTTVTATSDAYLPLNTILDILSFRPGASKTFVLITDEDRQPIGQSVAYGVLTSKIAAMGGTLHTILATSIDTVGQTTNALGITGNASSAMAFFPTTEVVNGTTVAAFNTETSGGVTFVLPDARNVTTVADFVNLAFDTGGTVWDLKKLRTGGGAGSGYSDAVVRESFTDAFSSMLANDIQLVSTDPTVEYEILDRVWNGGSLTYTLKFIGDGDAHDFDLKFVREHNPALILGSVPVTIKSDWVELDEAHDFNSTWSKTFTLPANAKAISASFFDLVFDTSDVDSMNDAVELALVDAQGNPLLGTIRAGRDAFFNLTEGESVQLGGGAIYDPGAKKVTFDVSHIAADTSVKLIVRLVNNDSDTTSRAVFDPDIVILTSSPIVAPSLVTPILAPRPAQAIDVLKLTSMDGGVTPAYRLTSFNEFDRSLSVDVTFKNTSTFSIDGPIIAVVRDITHAGVRAVDYDGLTPDGAPYYDITALVGDNRELTPNEISDRLALKFSNPNQVQFDFRLEVMGQLVQAPVFTGTPDTDVVAGVTYTYTATTDQEPEELTFSVVSGPATMQVGEHTGIVTWPTTTADVGYHTVTILVSNCHGMQTEQTFTIRVRPKGVNQTPYFVSSPLIEAHVNDPYVYASQAVDPDGDTLSYTIASVTVNGQPGYVVSNFGINASTGVVSWTPPAELAGKTLTVVLQASDPAIVRQTYLLYVQPQMGNTAPMIISTPATTHVVPGLAGASSGVVTPDAIVLELAPGQTLQQAVQLEVGAVGNNGTQPAGQASTMIVQNSTNVATLQDALSGHSGLVIRSMTVSGMTNSQTGWSSTGYFVNNNATYGLGSYGLVMSTGNAAAYGSGPFGTTNATTAYGVISSAADETLLNTILGTTFGYYDVTRIDLTFDLLPNFNAVSFQMVYGSEEFPEFRDTQFIDPIGVFLNGSQSANNIAKINGQPISINQSVMAAIAGTELDGVLALGGNPILTFVQQLTPGSTNNTLTFILGDSGLHKDDDDLWDTTVFLQNLIGVTTSTFNINVEPSIVGAPAVNLTGTQTGLHAGDLANYNVQFTGTGAGSAFTLNFVNTANNNILGKIPVTINSGYFYLVQAVDPDGDTLTYSLAQAPAGATIDPGTSLIRWNPPAAGNYDFRVRVEDGKGGLDEQSFVVTVTTSNVDNHAPTIDSLPSFEAEVNRPFAAQINAQDSDGDGLRYYLTSPVPDGMAIDNNSGLITWIPGSGQANMTYSQGVQVTDRRGGVTTTTVQVYVAPSTSLTNSSPTIVSSPVTAAVSGVGYQYRVRAIDPDGNVLTYRLMVGPKEAYIDPQTGVVVWTPRPDDVGDHRFVVQADDGEAVDVQSFNVRVFAENQTPLITPVPVPAASAAKPWSYQIVADDPNGDVLRYSIDTASTARGLSIDSAGNITWAAPVLGDYGVDVLVDDGRGGKASFTFTLPVRTNAPPTITSLPGTAARVNAPWVYAITASDPDGNPITYTLDADSLARGIVLSDDSSRPGQKKLSWTPGYAGDFPVTVTVTDGNNAPTSQTFTLAVQPAPPANVAPVIVSEPSGPAARNVAWRYKAAATDANGDNVAWSLDLSAVPLWQRGTGNGRLIIDGNTGLVTWTPLYAGSYEISVIATDAPGGASTRQTFTLVVLDNAPPSFTSSPVTAVALGGTYAYNVDAVDPNPEDNAGLVYSFAAPVPEGMTINPQTGVIGWSLTTNPAPVGTYPIIVQVTDTDRAFALQSYKLRVYDPAVPNGPPTITTPIVRTELGVGQRLLRQMEATDPNGDPLSWSLTNAPAGMRIDSKGLIDWTPTGSQAGQSFTFQVLVTDSINAPVALTHTLSVVNQFKNARPTFVLAPSTNLTVDNLFEYAVQGTDPDGDTLVYSLVSPPDRMSIDRQTGLIRWLPTMEDQGEHVLTVRVLDTYGAGNEATVTLTVRPVNSPPIFAPKPPNFAIKDVQYTYRFQATDPEKQRLTYSLGPQTNASGAIQIDPVTGDLTWTPALAGTQSIEVDVVDELGLGVAYGFSVPVLATPPNTPPRITNRPVPFVGTNEAFSFTPSIDDPNSGDTITIALTSLPSGVTFDPNTGAVSWPAGMFPAGASVAFQYKLNDGTDLAYQGFVVQVTPPNDTPVLTPVPDQTVARGALLAVDVRATDNIGIPLTFTLTGAPTGMKVDNQGRIRWQTSASDSLATYQVTVTASDGRLSASDQFAVTIGADTQAPAVSVTSDLNPAAIGSQVAIRVHAVDNLGVTARTLTLVSVTNGGVTTTLNQGLALDADGLARLTLTPAHLGTLTFSATARDAAGNVGPGGGTLTVYDPSDVSAPTAVLLSPTLNQVITEPIDVRGTIYDAQGIQSWTLTATPLDGGKPVDFATGSTAVSAGVLDKFDPTLFRNGLYKITLTVIDIGGNKSTDQVTVKVDGALKLGNVSMSFVDLQVPVVGIPITVTRTYNSLEADKQGDFGYGWKLDLSNTGVEVSQPNGATNGFFGYTPFVDGTRVVITLPDGTKEGFTFYGNPATLPFSSVGYYYVPKFVPDYGVTSTLIAGGTSLRKELSTGEYYDLESGRTYNPADPAFGGSYELTLRNGTSLIIHAETGDLYQVADLSGNTLTFTGMGIETSAGRSIEFERDYAGRIVSITDPNGRVLKYGYDEKGDLVSFTDRAGGETRFTYLSTTNPRQQHYLEDIIDPVGRTAAHNVFESGRLKRTVDADGKIIEYTWNGTTKTQVVTDQLGYTTTIVTDARGNILSQVDPTGVTQLWTYDNRDRRLSETLVVGQIDSAANGEANDLKTTFVYNTAGDLIETIDPRGQSTFTGYNDYGQPTSTTDAAGNTTITRYDDRGLPSTITDSLGNVTTLTHDDRGNLLTVINSSGQTLVTNTYNQYGDVLTSTPANGAGRTIYFAYDANGDQIASWYYDGVDAAKVQVLSLTERDGERRVTSTAQAIFTYGNFVETNFAAMSIASISPTFRKWFTTTTYNLSGQVIESLDQTGLMTRNTYDLRGQLIQTRRQVVDETGVVVWVATRTVYDAAGRVTASTDEYRCDPSTGDSTATTGTIEGNVSAYDHAGKVTSSQRVRGISVSITGSGNLLESVLAAAGTEVSTTTTVYDTSGRVVQSSDSFNLKTYTLYNKFGEVVQTRTESFDGTASVELVTRTVYDSLGRVTFTTDAYPAAPSTNGTPISGTIVFATQTIYDSHGRAFRTVRLKDVQIVLTNGETSVTSTGTVQWVTETIYDSQGRVSRQIGQEGQATDYVYDALGRQIAVIGPAVTLTIGQAVPAIAAGTVVRLRTETDYDPLGRAYKQRTNIVQFADGTTNSSAKQETTYEYDSRGNVVKTTFADGKSITATYDALGRKATETNQLLQTRSFTYDAAGRLASVTLPDVDPSNGVTTDIPVYRYGYDTHGNQALLIDPLGRETRWSFDPQGRLLARSLPLAFGSDGKITGGETWNPASAPTTEHFTYDNRGRMTLAVSFEGVVTQYVYDDARGGRLSQKKFFDNLTQYNSGAGTPSETWSYAYDAFGREVTVAQAVSAGSTRTVMTAYDAEGRVKSISSPEGVVGYTYDALGRQTQTAVYAVGANPASATPLRTTTYTYDVLGRVATVVEDRDGALTTDALLTTKYFYDVLGNLDLTLLPNNVAEDYVYDNLNRLDVLTTYKSDGSNADLADLSTNTKVAKFDYSLNNDGKRSGSVETHYDASGAVQFTNTYTWTYDGAGRVKDETLNSSHATLKDYKATYTYDLAGNRLTRNTDVDNNASIDEYFTYTYDVNDRLLTETNNSTGTSLDRFTEYEFGTGNSGTQQTKKTVHDGLLVSGTTLEQTTFAYDLQGRMAVVLVTTKNAQGNPTRIEQTTYDYDESGIRISAKAQTDTNADNTWDSTTTTTFLSDPHNPTGYAQTLRESTFNGSGVLTTTIDYSFGHDEITQVTRTYNASGTATGETTLVFSHDGHGSVRVVLDLAAALQQLYTYDAYGQFLAILNASATITSGGGPTNLASASTALTSFLYNGESFDTRIGQQYLRARWYNPATGRFDRLDDFFGNNRDPQSFHKYNFTHPDPVNWNDPTGQFFAVIGALAGFSLRSNFDIQRAPVYAAALGLVADLALAANVIYLRNASALHYAAGTFIPVDKSRLESHYHAVRIVNSQRTVDEIFSKMSHFTELNTYPSRALQNAGPVGTVVTWDMTPPFFDLGQADFDVKVTRYSPEDHTFVVRTLAGHPLAGWRLWRVREMSGGDILVETFSVEHPATAWDDLKIHTLRGLSGMYNTWTNMLKDLAHYSGGSISASADTVLGGEDRTAMRDNYLKLVE